MEFLFTDGSKIKFKNGANANCKGLYTFTFFKDPNDENSYARFASSNVEGISIKGKSKAKKYALTFTDTRLFRTVFECVRQQN